MENYSFDIDLNCQCFEPESEGANKQLYEVINKEIEKFEGNAPNWFIQLSKSKVKMRPESIFNETSLKP